MPQQDWFSANAPKPPAAPVGDWFSEHAPKPSATVGDGFSANAPDEAAAPEESHLAGLGRALKETAKGLADFVYTAARATPANFDYPSQVAAQKKLIQGVKDQVSYDVQGIRESDSMLETAARIGGLPLDVLGIPATAIGEDIGGGRYGHAAGLALGAGALMAAPAVPKAVRAAKLTARQPQRGRLIVQPPPEPLTGTLRAAAPEGSTPERAALDPRDPVVVASPERRAAVRQSGPETLAEDALYTRQRDAIARGEDTRSAEHRALGQKQSNLESFRDQAAQERGEVPIPRTPDTAADWFSQHAPDAEAVAPGRALSKPTAPETPAAALSPDEARYRTYRDDAREQGYSGTDAQFRMEFNRRLESARALVDEEAGTLAENGPKALLQAIANEGGLRLNPADPFHGEIAALWEHSKSGSVNQTTQMGRPWTQRLPTADVGGVSNVIRQGNTGGKSLDGMLEALRQDPRFGPHLESINDLLVAVEDAARMAPEAEATSLSGALEAAGVRRGSRWWDDPGSVTARDADLDLSMFRDEGTGAGGAGIPRGPGGGDSGGGLPPGGEPIPPARPLSAAQIADDAFLSKLPPDLQPTLRKVWEDYQGFGEQRRQVQPVARTQALADRLDLPETLPAGQALNAEGVTATYDRLIGKEREYQQLQQKIAAKEPLTDLDHIRRRELEIERVLAAERVRGVVAESGRAMHAIRVKVEELRALQAVQQSHDVGVISETAAALKGGAFRQYVYGNLVSSVASNERNLMGNTLMLAQDILADVATGKPGAAGAMTVGALHGLPRGLKEFAHVMRHGGGSDPLGAGAGKLPVFKEMPGGALNPWNDALRLLQATDRLGRAISNQAEITRRSYIEARKLGGNKPLADRMSRLRAEHPEWATEANDISTNRLFQSDSGPITQAFTKLRDTVPGGFLVAPFVRISANLMRMGVASSPAPYVLKLAQTLSGDRKTFQFAQDLAAPGRKGELARARAAYGSLVLGALTPYVLSGNVTGDGPRDPGRRALWLQENQPNSIWIGRWVSLQTLPGVGLPLQALANGVETYKDIRESGRDIDLSELAGNVLARTGNSILSQSFLSGVEDLQKAFENPKAYAGRALARFTTMVQPMVGLQRSIAHLTDTTVRSPRGVGEAWRANTPGLSSTVQPMLDPYGETVQRQQSPLTIGVLRMMTPKQDPITQTLLNLRVPLPRPDGDINLPEGAALLTRDQQTQLAQARGREKRSELEELILANPQWWASLSPDEQRERIARAKAGASRRVNERALGELMRDALANQLTGAR